ncbi:MAG: hypothetical protein JNL11_02990 [Bdellovibrionaceae bacterium]|nr:hypothetical protein [Pseudobdellovibrionaceae bacterium]
MKYIKSILFLVLSITQISFAGGWVVGGGEIMGDAVNPWFLNNNPDIKYCVVIDEANFGLSRSEAESITKRGIDFWMRQFKGQSGWGQDFILSKLNFALESCKPTTDLKLQFGLIDLKQMSQLPDLDRKVAVSVRTDYDRVNMRGKGFIYISPEKGPLALSGPQIETKAWSSSKGLLTLMVMIHELGHVFGLSHNSVSLMDENYVEMIMTPGLLKFFKDTNFESELENYDVFKIARSASNLKTEMCMGMVVSEVLRNGKKVHQLSNGIGPRTSVLNAFFGIDFEISCYGQTIGFENGKYILDVTFGTNKYSQKETVRMEQIIDDSAYRHLTAMLKIFLPKEQKVLPGVNTAYYGKIEKSVTFRSKVYDKINNVYRPVIVTMYNDRSATVTTEFQGKIYADILGQM